MLRALRLSFIPSPLLGAQFHSLPPSAFPRFRFLVLSAGAFGALCSLSATPAVHIYALLLRF